MARLTIKMEVSADSPGAFCAIVLEIVLCTTAQDGSLAIEEPNPRIQGPVL